MLCIYCNTEKDLSEFEVQKINGKEYRRKKCKRCKLNRQYDRRYEIKDWFLNYKKELSCHYCGYSDYRALVFHHNGDKEKVDNLATLVTRGASRETILEEIKKCIVLCANCHSILHFDDRN